MTEGWTTLRGSPAEDSVFWIRLGARVEAKQHLPRMLSGALVARLQIASFHAKSWAFDPCVRLGLLDAAWTIHRTAGSGEYSVDIRPWTDYAAWLIGKSERRPTRNGVRRLPRNQRHYARRSRAEARGQAFAFLVGQAPRDRRAMDILVSVVCDREAPGRTKALAALADVADGQARCASQAFDLVCSVIRDPADPARVEGLNLLGHRFRRHEQGRIQLLCKVARDREDPLRVMAIEALELAIHHPVAVDTLCRILADRTDECRSAAMSGLYRRVTMVGGPDPEVLDLILAIAREPADSCREEAIGVLGDAVEIGSQAAADLLIGIAGTVGDPHRRAATKELRFVVTSGMYRAGRERVLERCFVAANDPGYPVRRIALGLLRVAARSGVLDEEEIFEAGVGGWRGALTTVHGIPVSLGDLDECQAADAEPNVGAFPT